MKIFLDTANRDLIKKWSDAGVIDGVTTNPSLLSKEGPNTKEVLTDICKMVDGDVSIEVVKKDPKDVYDQAIQISKLAKNVVVKIPFAQEYLPVIKKLAQEGVKLNITLIFSLIQATLVAKMGVKYISPFIGRWDDIDIDGMEIVEKIMIAKENYNFKSEVIAASVRHVMHWHQSILLGAEVVTVPPQLLEKVMYHPLTSKGIELFDADWAKLGKEDLLS